MKKIGKQLDYKWIVVAACILMTFTALGFCSSSKSLFVIPITESLGVSRSLYSITDSFRYVSTSIINIFFGFLLSKFGIRKLIAAGFLSLIIAMLFFAFATSLALFYLGGVFLGMGFCFTTTTMIGTIVNKWCKENKGTIMGIVLSSNGVGAAMAIQILSPIIYNKALGYKFAYLLIAVILVIVAIIVLILIKDKPSESPANQSKSTITDEELDGLTFKQAIKMPYFYGIVFSIFICGMLLQGITGIATPLLQDVGLKSTFVASLLSLHSICLSVSKFSIGFMYDRLGLNKTSNFCFIMGITVMLLLPNVTNSPTGNVLAVIYEIFSSFALPLETVMLPLYALSLFGSKEYAKFLGIFASVNTAGYAVGAPIFNACYDLTGTYTVSLYAAAALMFVAFVIMQFVIKYANKLKRNHYRI